MLYFLSGFAFLRFQGFSGGPSDIFSANVSGLTGCELLLLRTDGDVLEVFDGEGLGALYLRMDPVELALTRLGRPREGSRMYAS